MGASDSKGLSECFTAIELKEMKNQKSHVPVREFIKELAYDVIHPSSELIDD